MRKRKESYTKIKYKKSRDKRETHWNNAKATLTLQHVHEKYVRNPKKLPDDLIETERKKWTGFPLINHISHDLILIFLYLN